VKVKHRVERSPSGSPWFRHVTVSVGTDLGGWWGHILRPGSGTVPKGWSWWHCWLCCSRRWRSSWWRWPSAA